MREDPDTPMKGIPPMNKHISTHRRLRTVRIAAVFHLALALFVLLALARMDNTDVQAAAAYMWAGCAILLAIGTFTTGDKEGK
nr:MAG TPA: hypothetical protein [Caudoviricetes sp.]